MGKYDDLLAEIPKENNQKPAGRYDDLLAEIPKANNQNPVGKYDDLLAEIPKTKPQQTKRDLSLQPVTVNGIDTGELYNEADRALSDKGVQKFSSGTVMYGMDNKSIPAASPLQQAKAKSIATKIFKENADANNYLKAAPELSDSILRVGARQGIAGIGKAEAGLVKLAGDLVGSDTLTGIADAIRQSASDYENGVVLQHKNIEGFAPDSVVQKLPNAAVGATNSVIQMVPSLVLGGATKIGALPALFGQTATQEYANNREAGQSLIPALLNASGKAGFEVTGEKLGGLDKVADALKVATKGNGIADLGASLISGSVKETPSELFTTAGTFGVDKMPLIGNNQDATLGDLGNQLVDTALTSMIQGGGMAAGGTAIHHLANKPQQATPQVQDSVVKDNLTPEQPNQVPPQPQPQPQQQAQTGLNVEGVLSALNKAKELVEAKRVAEQATQQATQQATEQLAQKNDIDLLLGSTGNNSELKQEEVALQSQAPATAIEPAQPLATEKPAPTFEERMAKHGDMLKAWLPDFGWNTEGGKLIRDFETGEASGRTVWEPKNEYLDYVRSSLGRSYTVMQKSVEKALAGKPLGKRQLEDVTAVMDLFDELGASNDAIVTGDPAQDDLYNQLANDEAWSNILEGNAVSDEILSDIAHHYQIELDANKEAGSLDYGFNPETEGTTGQGSTRTQADVSRSPEKTVQPSAASQGQISETGEQTTSERENVAPQTNQAARSAVETIAKRRAAANQINKPKQFDTALQLAKDFLNGEQVSPIKFANAAKIFANDPPLAEAFKQLHAMAKVPAKQAKANVNSMIDSYKQIIDNAKSLRELQQIGRDIQDEDSLNDAQMETLDDYFMAAQDKFEEQGDEPALELTGETNADIQAKEKAAEETRKQEAEAAKKSEADAKVNDFALTGSNREADVAASQGAQDLFTEPKQKQEKTIVDDFGEKLEGARKDLVRAMSKEYSDDELSLLPLSKIWPLTDVNLIEDNLSAAVAYAARSMIPPKPRKPYLVERWVSKVKRFRAIAKMFNIALQSNPELMLKKMDEANLGQFKAYVQLLNEIDRDSWKRVTKAEEYPDAHHYIEGVKVNSPQVRVEVDGRSRSFDAKSTLDVVDKVNELLGKEKEKTRMKFEVRKSGNTFFINKAGDKNYSRLKTFENSKDAFNFIHENYDELLALWEQTKDKVNVKESDTRGKENRPRSGKDYRNGKNVTSEEFSKTFGFRGIQFGEWVKQGGKDNDRQGMLNQAYDALMDLSNIVGVPAKAMSLEGTLGLAFGARGKSKAAAHFEPDMLVINLTKTNGAGTLAHEWFHALDNYFQSKRADLSGKQREERYITYKPEPLYIHKTARGAVPMTLQKLERMRELGVNDGYYSKENWIKDPNHPEGVRPEIEERFSDLVNALNASPMKTRASTIDQGKEGGYWSRIIEMAARSFESYVVNKMQLEGYNNDYLANIARIETFNRDSNRFPYLLDSEISPVSEAFDALFSEMKTKEGEDGNVILFSKTKTNFSNGSGSYGLTKEQVKEAVKNDLHGMDIDVYQTFDEVPDYVKEQANSEAGGYVEGYYDPKTNRVALIASNLSSLNRAVEVVRHELIGHYGMENMLGKDLMLDLVNEVLDAEEAGNKTIIELAKHVDLTQPNISDFRRAKEIIAVMAERNMQNDIVRRVMDAVRKFLKRLGIINSNTTDAEIAKMLRDAQTYLQNQGRSIVTGSQTSFSVSAMKSTSANIKRGERSMNDALINKHDVNRAMYHNELGWIDFVIGDDNKGIQHIIKQRISKDEMSFSEVHNLLTNDLVKTIATGKIIRKQDIGISEKLVIANGTNEAILVKNKGNNGWLLTGWELKTPDASKEGNDTKKATHLKADSTDNKMGASALDELSNIAKGGVNDDVSFSRGNPQGNLAPQWDSLEDSGMMEGAIRALQDQHIDLKRVIQNIQKTGTQIDDKWNAYLQEELYHGRTAKRTQDFLSDELTPLIEDMRKRNVSMQDFEHYLWARHAEERNKKIASINDELPDGGSGMTTQEANDYLDGLSAEQRTNFEALAKRVDAITNKSNQILLDYGLESADTIAAWNGAYKHYVPLQREDMDIGFGSGTGQGFSIKGSASKRALGSNKNVVDILANIAMQREKNIVRGEKNRVATSLIGLAKLNPNDDFWQVDTPPTIKAINKATGLVEHFTDPNYKTQDNVVVARIKNKLGKIEERSVTFNKYDERAMHIAKSIKNLEVANTEEFIEAIGKVTRYFSSINTQYNPIFGLFNLTRDIQGSLLNLTTTPLAGKQAEVLKNTPAAIKAIYTAMRSETKGTQAPNTAWTRLFDDFQREGGQTGYRDMFKNASDRADALEKALDPDWWTKTKIGKVVTANGLLTVPETMLNEKAIRPLLDWLSDYNETFENAIRLSVYKSGIDAGLSKQQSASIAKNISVNFNRKGNKARLLGSLYAFFNASVQGTARIGETLTGEKGKQIIAGGLLLGAMQAMALSAMGFDDNEPPDYEKDRNIIIPIGNKKYLMVPMPLGFNAIPNLGRIVAEWALSGGKNTSDRIEHIFGMLADAVNPIGGNGSVANIIAPTVLDPVVDLSNNKDFTGKPIAKQDFSSLHPTPGFTRTKDTASGAGKFISYAVNYLSFGTDHKRGIFSPTPDQVDYLISQVTGGVGREVLKAWQTTSSIMTGEDLPTRKIPLAGRLYGDANEKTSQAGKFYDNLMKINEHFDEVKSLGMGSEKYKEYIKDNPEAAFTRQARVAESQVNKLRQVKKILVEKNADESRIKNIDERINASMVKFNNLVSSKNVGNN